MKTTCFVLVLSTLFARAQGPLPPPVGPPVASMKTLAQIEGRTPIESLPFTISTPGSYYFTKNLQFTATSGDAITITAKNVTLDLNGFTLSSSPAVTGKAITGSADLATISIKNGIIQGNTAVTIAFSGGVTWSVTKAGFSDGIYLTNAIFGVTGNLQVENIQVNGCRNNGILATNGHVTNSTATSNGGIGISAPSGSVTDSTAAFNYGNGIEANSGNVTNSCARSNGNQGIYADDGNVTGSVVTGNRTIGISASNGCVTGTTTTANNQSKGAHVDLYATDATVESCKYDTTVMNGRVAINSLPFTISTPGNYYLTKNLQFTATSGDAITIMAKSVTLDLNGFTLSSTPGVTGKAITGNADQASITIKNGIITGNTVVTIVVSGGISWAVTKAGFSEGISLNNVVLGMGGNLKVDNLQVSGCRDNGIVVTNGHVINSIATSNGGGGIIAPSGSVTDSAATFNYGNGIEANSGGVTNSRASSNGALGIFADDGIVTGSIAMGNRASGIKASDSSVWGSTTKGNDLGNIGSVDLYAKDAAVSACRYVSSLTAGSTLTGNQTP